MSFLCYRDIVAVRLTIRGLPDPLARRLKSLSQARGESINRTVIQILEETLGQSERRRGLARYATWSDEDLEEFEKALAGQRTIDETLSR